MSSKDRPQWYRDWSIRHPAFRALSALVGLFMLALSTAMLLRNGEFYLPGWVLGVVFAVTAARGKLLP